MQGNIDLNDKSLQEQIIKELKVKPEIVIEEELALRTNFICECLKTSHANNLIIGISGGVDSLLTGYLGRIAVDILNKNELNNNKYSLISCILPYLEQKNLELAILSQEAINADTKLNINIGNIVNSVKSSCLDYVKNNDDAKLDHALGNVKARIRMLLNYYLGAILYDKNFLVLGTANAAELLTGFFTKYGDGGVDIAPIASLNKRQVKAIASYLKLPNDIINAIPTADLEDLNELKADEDVLGITYEQMDNYLENKELESNIKFKIEQIYLNSLHKRKAPISL